MSSGSSSSGFKLKRSHSPDFGGFSNYKKQKLIQDFERLSLRDSSQNQIVDANNRLLDKIGIGLISIPKDVKKCVKGLRDNNTYTDERLVYEKLREVIQNEHSQVVRWYDPFEVVYQQWLRWVQTRWVAWPGQDYFNDSSNDRYGYENFYGGYDSDVDMDI